MGIWEGRGVEVRRGLDVVVEMGADECYGCARYGYACTVARSMSASTDALVPLIPSYSPRSVRILLCRIATLPPPCVAFALPFDVAEAEGNKTG